MDLLIFLIFDIKCYGSTLSEDLCVESAVLVLLEYNHDSVSAEQLDYPVVYRKIHSTILRIHCTAGW